MHTEEAPAPISALTALIAASKLNFFVHIFPHPRTHGILHCTAANAGFPDKSLIYTVEEPFRPYSHCRNQG